MARAPLQACPLTPPSTPGRPRRVGQGRPFDLASSPTDPLPWGAGDGARGPVPGRPGRGGGPVPAGRRPASPDGPGAGGSTRSAGAPPFPLACLEEVEQVRLLRAAMAGSESPAGGRGGVLRAGGGASSPPVPPAPAPSPSPGGQGRACFLCHPWGGHPGKGGRGHPAAAPGGPWPGRPVPGPQGCLLSTVGRQGRGRGAAARTCCWRSMAAPPLPNQNSEGVFSVKFLWVDRGASREADAATRGLCSVECPLHVAEHRPRPWDLVSPPIPAPAPLHSL